jgi:hypothetical protein
LKLSSSSAKAAGKIPNAADLHSMQRSINQITDNFEKSVTMPLDPQLEAVGQNKALHLVQTYDNGLTLEQQMQLLTIFMGNHIAAEIYVGLVNEDLKKSWLQSMLSEWTFIISIQHYCLYVVSSYVCLCYHVIPFCAIQYGMF